ncbi:MAG: trigger factor, partial [Synechococcales cyanobacterium RM1_1_8]|nr:trigger factor [Synechococcales cyanobacterium RM1_1_8]
MKVTQEKLPDSQLGLEIEIPGELSKQVYDQTLSKLSREVSLPGFRKGKIPRHILIQRLGSGRIKATAIEDLVQKGIDQAIAAEKIEALGNYQLKTSFDELIGGFEPGQPLTFSASVDVPPQPVMQDYRGLSLRAEEVKYDAAKVDSVLADYQKQLATLVPVEDRPAQENDVVIIDFKGHLDLPEDAAEGTEPEEIPGGSAEDFQVELGEGRFIPGFIEGILGMEPEETRTIAAQFPEDYPQAEVAGRAATFVVTLKEIKNRELPELDDDFAQEVSDFETLAELRESLEKRYRDEAEQKTRANKHAAIAQALTDKIDVELPLTLIERESNQILSQTLMRLSDQGMDVNRIFTPELAQQFRQQSRPEAIDRLKRTLSLGEIANAESITVSEEAIATKIAEVLENTTQDKAQIDMDRLRSIVKEDLLRDAILDWVEAQSTVELLAEGTLEAEAAALEAAELAAAELEAAAEPQSADSSSESEPGAIAPEDQNTIEVEAVAVADESEVAQSSETAAAPEQTQPSPKKGGKRNPAKSSPNGSSGR